jgi:hypothetical protein
MRKTYKTIAKTPHGEFEVISRFRFSFVLVGQEHEGGEMKALAWSVSTYGIESARVKHLALGFKIASTYATSSNQPLGGKPLDK